MDRSTLVKKFASILADALNTKGDTVMTQQHVCEGSYCGMFSTVIVLHEAMTVIGMNINEWKTTTCLSSTEVVITNDKLVVYIRMYLHNDVTDTAHTNVEIRQYDLVEWLGVSQIFSQIAGMYNRQAFGIVGQEDIKMYEDVLPESRVQKLLALCPTQVTDLWKIFTRYTGADISASYISKICKREDAQHTPFNVYFTEPGAVYGESKYYAQLRYNSDKVGTVCTITLTAVTSELPVVVPDTSVSTSVDTLVDTFVHNIVNVLNNNNLINPVVVLKKNNVSFIAKNDIKVFNNLCAHFGKNVKRHTVLGKNTMTTMTTMTYVIFTTATITELSFYDNAGDIFMNGKRIAYSHDIAGARTVLEMVHEFLHRTDETADALTFKLDAEDLKEVKRAILYMRTNLSPSGFARLWHRVTGDTTYTASIEKSLDTATVTLRAPDRVIVCNVVPFNTGVRITRVVASSDATREGRIVRLVTNLQDPSVSKDVVVKALCEWTCDLHTIAPFGEGASGAVAKERKIIRDLVDIVYSFEDFREQCLRICLIGMTQ